jgi:short-subunit dehydrogenase
MQHRFAGTAVRVVLIKPGPTDTPMTAVLKADGARLADVAQVARDTVRAIDRGVPVAYVPGRWRWIMWVVRSLPMAIFNRLDI